MVNKVAITLVSAGLAAMIFTLMSGCSKFSQKSAAQTVQYSVNVAQLTTTVSKVSKEISQTETIIKKHKKAFTAKQWASLKAAQKPLKKAQKTLRNITSGSATVKTVSLAKIQSVYNNAKRAYLNARPVIAAHESAFKPGQQLELKNLDTNAKRLDSQYSKIMTGTVNNVNVTQFLQTALSVAATGAKIAAIAGA